ncbi:hypothetical protein TOPH_05776 [Tolypocladium ophioglossoides CBS 100239]|uniref:MARVEL domain-containing protein n=1 Tax=Tolypocladium ophioglossoides (strain CBS 100239) TaxID=1163406 RepID=A0A0L0N6D6_TOLOC|nr:hypothetical protein TOPH_05776 [Tolypocladium ophioglossoides CBS 100239]
MATNGLTTLARGTGTGTLRALAVFCHFMIFASAAIVTGVVSYFLNKYSFRGAHVVYQEVIAVITLPLYFCAMFMPLFRSYEGYFLPVNFIFSYLWLTSFVFSASDWGGRLCRRTTLGAGRCSLKRTVEAFDFFAFFFLVCNILVEGYLLRESRRRRREEQVVTKERPGSGVSGHTEASAAPVAHNAETSATPAVQV